MLDGDADPPTEKVIWGLSGTFKSIGNLRCSGRCSIRFKMDHLITSNVMQQKGSFSMPGKYKLYSEIFWAQAMRPVLKLR